jgi:hypothetical protein
LDGDSSASVSRERASEVKPTGNVIINAVRAYAHLTDDGRWVEPEKKYIIEHVGHVESPEPADPVSTKRPPSQPIAPEAANPNSESAIRT